MAGCVPISAMYESDDTLPFVSSLTRHGGFNCLAVLCARNPVTCGLRRLGGGRNWGAVSTGTLFPCLCTQRERHYGSLYGSLSFPLRSLEEKERYLTLFLTLFLTCS
jgi:hypothetical protein